MCKTVSAPAAKAKYRLSFPEWEIFLIKEKRRPARKPKGVMARVLYDFAGEDADELPLREGQKVRVTRQHESGWWTGEINGKVGMFPANYVELLWTV